MARKPRIETALAHWIVDPATWRDFVRAVRAEQQQPHAPHCALELPEEIPAAGIEVLIRDDQVSVGRKTFEFLYADSLEVTLCDSWLQFGSHHLDTRHYIFPVPVPGHARSEAARVAHHFTEALAERSRIAAEERARPTLSNRLLNFVEGHFALSMFLLFFVLLPALVGFMQLLSLWFPSIQWIRDE